jgi:predicted outer membrane protein
MKRLVSFVALIALAMSAAASARPAHPRPVATASSDDSAVIARIVSGAVGEVKLCDFAATKTGTAAIVALCRSVSPESTRIALRGMQLSQTLAAADVTMEPSPDLPQVLDNLTQLSGHEFDRAFLLTHIEADENGEHAIRYAIEVTTNDALKGYETAALRSVERHLDFVESTLTRVTEDGP